jgi:hypothetical protein
MRNINDLNSKVIELVVVVVQNIMCALVVTASDYGGAGELYSIQSLLTWLWKSSSSSDLVKKYVAVPHAAAAIAITTKTTIFERFTALVSALAMLKLESLLTSPVLLVSVAPDREADSDE